MRQSAYPICRHIKTNGHRCQSPAHDPSAFCYHHRNLRRTPTRQPSQSPESSAILQTISIIARRASDGDMDRRDAHLMLRALEYANKLCTTQAK